MTMPHAMSEHVCEPYEFDRTICPEPCGDMHYYCSCGARFDRCAHEMRPCLECDYCGKDLTRAADDSCVNPEHRNAEHTLGLREVGCGCCVLVDRVALDLLWALTKDSER